MFKSIIFKILKSSGNNFNLQNLPNHLHTDSYGVSSTDGFIAGFSDPRIERRRTVSRLTEGFFAKTVFPSKPVNLKLRSKRRPGQEAFLKNLQVFNLETVSFSIQF